MPAAPRNFLCAAVPPCRQERGTSGTGNVPADALPVFTVERVALAHESRRATMIL